MAPYFLEVAEVNRKEGVSAIRTMFMQFPSDPRCLLIEDQFMVGDELLICPVIEANKASRSVYLPEGTWKHHFTEQIFPGAQPHDIHTPIGTPAVFWKIE